MRFIRKFYYFYIVKPAFTWRFLFIMARQVLASTPEKEADITARLNKLTGQVKEARAKYLAS
jgi:hypothetical protein